MNFQKCLNCEPDNWQSIAPEQLRAELVGTYANPDEAIDLVLIYNATAKTSVATYRRGKPVEPVKDWAVRS